MNKWIRVLFCLPKVICKNLSRKKRKKSLKKKRRDKSVSTIMEKLTSLKRFCVIVQ